MENRAICDAPVELRELDGALVISGYAATFDSLSHDLGGYREVIRRGAFDATMDEIKAGKRDVSARVQHDGGLSTIGRVSNGTLKLNIDSKGLHYTINPPDTVAGRDIATLVRDGYINKSSFAFSFRPDGRKWDRTTNPPTQELTGVNLIDVAPVDGPAYESTSVQARSAALASLQMESMRGRKSGIEIRANETAGPRVELYFLDQIVPSWLSRYLSDTMSSGEVVEALEAVPDASGIDVFINSPGGDVFEAMSIYNTLKEHPAPVNVYVRGLAASAAGIIAMAGDNIQMGEGSFLMVHNAWTIAQGNADQLQRAVNLLDKIDGEIAGIISRRSKNDADQVRQWMRDETWFTAEESVSAGLADRMAAMDATPPEMDGERCREMGYRNIPRELGGRGSIAVRPDMTAAEYRQLLNDDRKRVFK